MDLKKGLSVLFTLFIVLLVILSEPSRAINMSVFTDKPSYISGDLVEISVNMDMGSGEIVPFTNASISIYGIDPENRYFSNSCELNNISEGVHPECALQNPNFEHAEITYQNATIEFGNRTASNATDDFEWGYGYGYNSGPSRISLNIKWRYPVYWLSGNYRVKVDARTGKDLLNREPVFSSKVDFKAVHINGRVAYLCRDDSCSYGFEPQLMQWLESGGWLVDGKQYDAWSLADILEHDIIVCSDELNACKTGFGTPAYTAHKMNQKPLVEVGDYRYLSAGWRFGYADNYIELLNSEDLYVTRADPIMQGYSGSVGILPAGSKMSVIPDYYLKGVTDLADSGNHGRSTLFRHEQTGNEGRYAYVGWFYDKTPSDLTQDGSNILTGAINWVQCENIYTCNPLVPPDKQPPVASNGKPHEIVAFDTPNLGVDTDEYATCKGSINVDEPYENMDFEFTGAQLHHEYQVMTPLPNGEYAVYVRCTDYHGNNMGMGYSWMFEVRVPVAKNIAYLCRDDSCSYGFEPQLMQWLDDQGWIVEGKGYDKWTEAELRNHEIIICSDELKACKVGASHPAYVLHKNEKKPFVEIGDYRYLSAGWRFGYADNYIELLNSEDLYVTRADPIMQGYSGSVGILPAGSKMSVIPDYYLKGVTDLADSGNHGRSTLFRHEQTGNEGRYAYVGWFYDKTPSDLTGSGSNILRRTVNWAQCENVDGCAVNGGD